jgi:hypothetical protein
VENTCTGADTCGTQNVCTGTGGYGNSCGLNQNTCATTNICGSTTQGNNTCAPNTCSGAASNTCGYTNVCNPNTDKCSIDDSGCVFSDCCQSLNQCSSGFSCSSQDTPPDLQNNIIGIIGGGVLAIAFG